MLKVDYRGIPPQFKLKCMTCDGTPEDPSYLPEEVQRWGTAHTEATGHTEFRGENLTYFRAVLVDAPTPSP
ncbi:hypothetical protein ACFP1Z_08575 [Streptomyces gamaensis]|uniref:DUF7848 domain-containing protein n=2 Tax=Streptomyces gamaensis TaxID=1763542 RepID=A0ABW0YXF0_9ACTN